MAILFYTSYYTLMIEPEISAQFPVDSFDLHCCLLHGELLLVLVFV